MNEMSFVDIVLCIKKHLGIILLCTILGAVFAFGAVNLLQGYTASVTIEYTHAGADQGLNPVGGALDPYEIMNPAIISRALDEMDSDLSVEQVRNQLSVSPMIESTAAEVKQALTEKGEEYEVNTTEYLISYSFDAKYGYHFGNHLLYNLLKVYDDYFLTEYLGERQLSDFMAVTDVDSMDYMELCDYVESNLSQTIQSLSNLAAEAPEFRSAKTGLDFATLRSFYSQIASNEYRKLYADVREGLLSKDLDKLLKGWRKQVEELTLQRDNAADESELSRSMVILFYEIYKKNNLYYKSYTAAAAAGNYNTDQNRNMVYSDEIGEKTNTYDDIFTRYVTTAVNSSDLTYDIEHLNTLLADFSSGTISADAKAMFEERCKETIQGIKDLSVHYTALANETMLDYFDQKVANSLNYAMAVSVTPNMSVLFFSLLGAAIAFFAACVIVVIVQMFSLSMAQKNLKALANAEGGGLGEISTQMIEDMSVMERAFYEQALHDFDEFHLMYQPIVNKKSQWEIAEALIRWDSRRLGKVFPAEFIPIAQKYGLFDELGKWILRSACKQLEEWEKDGFITNISVNFSVSQIESQSFLDSMSEIMAATTIDARHIYIEVSGGGELSNIETAANKFTALKAFGVSIALDRFGESMSSIRTLYDLPVDMVKIDKRLISSLTFDTPADPVFMQAVSICKERGFKLCMEGVESEWQMDLLRQYGADYFQGYYFSHPLEPQAYRQQNIAEE